MSLAVFLLWVVAPGTATAGSSRNPYAMVTIVCRHACLLNKVPVIQTDAHHAALVRRAGAIPLVAQPNPGDRPIREKVLAVRHGLYWIDAGVGAGTALLILGSGAALVARRRKPLPA